MQIQKTAPAPTGPLCLHHQTFQSVWVQPPVQRKSQGTGTAAEVQPAESETGHE